MAIVWDYSARNRRQKLRKFTPANVTPPKSRDHAVPGLIEVADCRNVPALEPPGANAAQPIHFLTSRRKLSALYSQVDIPSS
jgi:hypothetical protein